jgi:uncharacterized membrane protein
MKNFFRDRLWLVYTILAALSWAIWGILTKYISGDISPYTYHILFTIGMLFSLPFVTYRIKNKKVNIKGIFLGSCTGVLAVIGNISVFQSLKLGGQASVVIPLSNLYPLITILIALVIFREKLSLINGLGILIIIPAVIILSGQSQIFNDPIGFFQGLGLKAWLLFAFLSMLLFGLFSASQKVTTNYLSAEWSYISFIASSVLVSVCFIALNLVNFGMVQSTLWIGSLTGIFDGLGVLAIYSAYQVKGKASQVSPVVSALQQLFTLFLAITFLKERLSFAEFTGIGLAILGLLFLLLEKKKI